MLRGMGEKISVSGVVERALELAASGKYLSTTAIRAELHREGFSHAALSSLNGKAIRKSLRSEIVRATQDTTAARPIAK